MKLLVFGKTGQVASELRRLAEVISLDRQAADLSRPEDCAAIVKTCDADVIINAAAFTAVDQAEETVDLATVINGEAPGAMARAAAERGLPFLHVSTDYVFDGSGQTPWQPTAPPAPVNAYGQTKLMGEQAIADAGGAFGILRTSWVFSAHGSNFVKTMLRLGKERAHLNIVDDQIGGPTPAAAIADCLLTMAKAFHDRTGTPGIYHFSGAPDISWKGFAEEIFRQAGLNVAVAGIPTSAYPTPAQRPLNSRLDCSETLDKFGVERPDWRTGLTEVLKELGELRDE